MACNTFHLIDSDAGCYAIQRGASLGAPPSYAGHAFFMVGVDLTGWTAIGQIKADYASAGGAILASFTFGTLTYGTFTLANASSVTGTRILMTMPASTTRTLALPPKWKLFKPEAPEVGKTCWLYDVKLISPSGESGGVSELISPSFVQVVDDVSRS